MMHGRKLRIYQQYFMVSNAAQLILDEATAKGCNLHDLADYAVDPDQRYTSEYGNSGAHPSAHSSVELSLRRHAISYRNGMCLYQSYDPCRGT